MLDSTTKARIEELFIACPDQWSFEDSYREICRQLFEKKDDLFLDTPQNRDAIFNYMDEIYSYI